MITTRMAQIGLMVLLTAGSVSAVMAGSPNDFVEKAAQGGIAEIESSKVALEKSSAADVKAFAQHMIDDHTRANQDLMGLAKKLEIDLPDVATLTAQANTEAKKMALDVRPELFDKTYADKQVKAHEKALLLFKEKAAATVDTPLKVFAEKTLPTLEMHLDMAKKLQSQHAR